MFEKFLGTKKYHNYTKNVQPHETGAMRYMLKLESNEYVYMNKNTFELTNAEDKDGIEFVHFFLKGQSFLYNQIRKMVGIII